MLTLWCDISTDHQTCVTISRCPPLVEKLMRSRLFRVPGNAPPSCRRRARLERAPQGMGCRVLRKGGSITHAHVAARDCGGDSCAHCRSRQLEMYGYIHDHLTTLMSSSYSSFALPVFTNSTNRLLVMPTLLLILSLVALATAAISSANLSCNQD